MMFSFLNLRSFVLISSLNPHSFKCNMRFYHDVSANTLRASKNDNMGNSFSLIVVTKFLLVLTLIINQLPHSSAQDYLGKRSENTNDLKNMIRVIKRSSNNDEEYPEETSSGNDMIYQNYPWISNENLPEASNSWWDQLSPTEEKRGTGNMLRMIKRISPLEEKRAAGNMIRMIKRTSPSEEKRAAGNMIRMIKRNLNDKNLGFEDDADGGSAKSSPYAAWRPPFAWNHSLFWKRGNQYAAKRKKEANIFRLIE